MPLSPSQEQVVARSKVSTDIIQRDLERIEARLRTSSQEPYHRDSYPEPPPQTFYQEIDAMHSPRRSQSPGSRTPRLSPQLPDRCLGDARHEVRGVPCSSSPSRIRSSSPPGRVADLRGFTSPMLNRERDLAKVPGRSPPSSPPIRGLRTSPPRSPRRHTHRSPPRSPLSRVQDPGRPPSPGTSPKRWDADASMRDSTPPSLAERRRRRQTSTLRSPVSKDEKKNAAGYFGRDPLYSTSPPRARDNEPPAGRPSADFQQGYRPVSPPRSPRRRGEAPDGSEQQQHRQGPSGRASDMYQTGRHAPEASYQPSVGRPSADASYQQPSVGRPSPDSSYQQPSVGRPSAGDTSYQQPSVGRPSAGDTSYQQPSVGRPSPDSSYQQPSVGRPSAGDTSYQQPSVGRPSAGDSYQQPSVGRPSPDSSYQQRGYRQTSQERPAAMAGRREPQDRSVSPSLSAVEQDQRTKQQTPSSADTQQYAHQGQQRYGQYPDQGADGITSPQMEKKVEAVGRLQALQAIEDRRRFEALETRLRQLEQRSASDAPAGRAGHSDPSQMRDILTRLESLEDRVSRLGTSSPRKEAHYGGGGSSGGMLEAELLALRATVENQQKEILRLHEMLAEGGRSERSRRGSKYMAPTDPAAEERGASQDRQEKLHKWQQQIDAHHAGHQYQQQPQQPHRSTS